MFKLFYWIFFFVIFAYILAYHGRHTIVEVVGAFSWRVAQGSVSWNIIVLSPCDVIAERHVSAPRPTIHIATVEERRRPQCRM